MTTAIDPIGAATDMKKRIRSEVRLKHSLLADEELRDILPKLMNEFQSGLQDGILLELQPGTLSFYVDSENV